MNSRTVGEINTIVRDVLVRKSIPNWLFIIYKNVAVRYAKWVERDGLNAKNTIVSYFLSAYDALDKDVVSEIFNEIDRRIFAYG